MKRTITVALFLVVVCSAFGQEKRINLYSAYVFDDSFETINSSTSYYNGKIIGGYQWGAGVEVKPNEELGVELLYIHQNTNAPVAYYDLTAKSRDLDIGVSYILLGGNRYMKTGKVEPYGGILLGAAVFNNQHPQSGEGTSETRFAVGARLGVNVWTSDRVALKLQAMFLSSVQGVGGGFYFGTGGAGTGVSTYSTITQLSLGGGLGFRLGQ
jgi:opacity protein-like surface antigen